MPDPSDENRLLEPRQQLIDSRLKTENLRTNAAE